MKKKQPAPKPKEFRPAPFTALKGFSVPSPPPPPHLPEPPKSPPPAAAAPDDLDLFWREVSDVRPMTGARQEERRAGTKPVVPPPATRVRMLEEEDRQLFLTSLEGMDVRFEEEIPDEDNPLRPLSASRLKQLRQGTITIRMELDLHGLTRDEALASLGRFIDGAWRRQMEAVLVITGKGNNSPGEPVLQAVVTGWLRDRGKKQVVEFAPAPRQMGGTGAFVVFLRPHGQT